MRRQPPQLMNRLLEKVLPEFLSEGILGDLEEQFQLHLEKMPLWQARLIYVTKGISFLKLAYAKPKNLFSTSMYHHYFITALRNLRRHSAFSAINVFGLGTAMSLCLLIILFYVDQKSMDQHNPQAHNIFRILTTKMDPDGDRTWKHATTPYEVPFLLKENFPSVKTTSTLMQESGEAKYGDKILGFSGLYAQSNFFDFFGYQLSTGDINSALAKPMSMVLSKELATKFFRDKDPFGESISIEEVGTFVVTGIVEDLPGRSHLKFDLLLSFSSLERMEKFGLLKGDWEKGSERFHNYVQTQDGQANGFISYLNKYVSHFPREVQADRGFDVQRLSEINFDEPIIGETGFAVPGFVFWFLAVIAIVVMVSAVFNYIGLSIAQSLRRTREVGIKKALGAERRQVIMQFLVEAQVTVFISWVVAMLLLQLLVPVYNSMKVLRDIDGSIDPNVWQNGSLYLGFLGFAILLGFMAGGYPACYVGKFRFHEATKRATTGKSQGFGLRKVLTFLQYGFSIIFIITALVLHKQSNLFFDMDYGFDQRNMISIPAHDIPYEAIKTELLRNPHIESVGKSSALPALNFIPKKEFLIPGKEQVLELASFSINEDFVDNLELAVLTGERFRKGSLQDKRVMVNESYCHEFGLDINSFSSGEHLLTLHSDSTRLRIIGVIEDFKFNVLFRESGPLVLTSNTDELAHINIKFSGIPAAQAAEEIEQTWRQFDKLHAFDYSHYEYELADMYEEFKDIVWIVGLAAALAIIIACIGQFGMILHHVELKTKEVGIRKVLGSSNPQLILLLSKGYLWLTFFAFLPALPLAWWMNDAWTQLLGYHVEVGPALLSTGVILVLTVSLFSIFSLTIKAANKNPVETLKYE